VADGGASLVLARHALKMVNSGDARPRGNT